MAHFRNQGDAFISSVQREFGATLNADGAFLSLNCHHGDDGHDALPLLCCPFYIPGDTDCHPLCLLAKLFSYAAMPMVALTQS